MSWEEIRGQDSAISFLKNVLIKGKLSGAYLFVGPEGVGKRLTAKNFAKVLNCQRRLVPQRAQVSFDCCDECPSCLKVDSFNHPDVNWIETLKGTQKISIEQVRNIKRGIALKPYEGRIKIYVILKAELLTEEASNCILKTLEEPPRAATLILTTSDMRRLLPTIISRCQIVKFSSLPVEEVEEILKSRLNLLPEVATFLANLCEGRLGKAIELKDRDILREKNEIINQLTAHSSQLTVDKSRKEIEEILKILLSWYRDVLISKCKIQSLPLINLDRREEVLNLANKISFEKLSKAVKTIIDTYTFIQQNANPKLALETMASEIKDVSR